MHNPNALVIKLHTDVYFRLSTKVKWLLCKSAICGRYNIRRHVAMAAVESLRAAATQPPPSPPVSPYCVELPEDVVEKIAELDLELSEGDITQKGYEKKKNKLLAPFLRENQPNKSNEDSNKNGVKTSQTNGAALSQPSSSSSSVPSAPPAESSLTTSGTSGLSDSSGVLLSIILACY